MRRTDAAPAAARGRFIAPRIVTGSLLALAVVVIAAVAAWPIYRSPSYVLLVGAGTALAVAIATVAWLRRWGGWLTAGVLAAVLFVVGVPLAVPSRLGSPLEVLQGLGEVATGVVFGWKDLVTVDLPVGSYRNLLVPALVVFLVGTCAMLLLVWRAGSVAYVAVPIAIGMVSFGLFFGRESVSAPFAIGPVTLYAPIETALGVATLATTLVWLAWRTHDERVRALQRAAVSSGVRVSRRPSRADRRSVALGAGMVVAALAIVVAVVPFAARGAEREVLRSAIGPDVDLSNEISPLSKYRAQFAPDRADEVLFTVHDAAGADRVRIATLDAYDGEVFRAGGGSGAAGSGRFARVPSVLDAGEGTPVRVGVEIATMDGVWMPTVGRLTSVDFAGSRSASLADGFYYNAAAAAGVQTAGGGLRTGDRFVVSGVEPAQPDLADIDAPGVAAGDVAAPESLRAWVDEHATGSDGAALQSLVQLLRERGYLSHALSEEGSDAWMANLADYSFQPSASGHSLARVDQMFRRLLEREDDPRAAASGNFVAAIGDDEQFAVAVALIARELGFPSRVVVGVRLSTPDSALSTCDSDGACQAQDLAAWTEVQSATGDWVAIDVTPQHAVSPSLEVTQQRDPENVTDVLPESVEEVVPPEPLQEDSAPRDAVDDEAGLDLAWLWPLLRIGGIVMLALLVVLGPFLVVLTAKALRRRARRNAASPVERVAGGWDEYVDAAVDAGREAPRASTRSELAAAFDTPAGVELAEVADRAVFSRDAGSQEDVDAFWRRVDEERRALRRGGGFWRGFATTVSLRSFMQRLAPAQGVRRRFTERRKRRAPQPVRLTP